VLAALGELLQVQQLPASHDQITERQRDGGQADGLHDHLEQQERCVVLLGRKDIGHEAAHDGARQLSAPVDRHDTAQLLPAGRGEAFADSRLGQAYQHSRRAAAEVVDPPVGMQGARVCW
jgi:hypothetical protein